MALRKKKRGPGRPKGSSSKKSAKKVMRKKRRHSSDETVWQIVPFGKGTTFAFIENGRKIATRFTIGSDHVTINDVKIEGDEGLRDVMMTIRRIGKKYSD